LGKAFHVQTYKDFVFVIQCPVQSMQEPQRVKKLKTAKAVMDKILWSNLNKEDFRVGYIDKNMGLVETNPFNIERFDVKDNAIKYFKKNNTIVWDRENKIDFF
jgi:hypothetical protein